MSLVAPKALLGRGSWASRPRLAQGQLLLLSLLGPPTALKALARGLLCAEAIQNLSTGPLPGGLGFSGFSLSQEPRPILARPPPRQPRFCSGKGSNPRPPSAPRLGWGGRTMWPRDLAARPRPVKAGPGRGRSTRAPLPGRAGDQGAAGAHLPRLPGQPSSRRPIIESRLSFSLSDMAAPPLWPSTSGPYPASRPPAASFRPGAPSARPGPPRPAAPPPLPPAPPRRTRPRPGPPCRPPPLRSSASTGRQARGPRRLGRRGSG